MASKRHSQDDDIPLARRTHVPTPVGRVTRRAWIGRSMAAAALLAAGLLLVGLFFSGWRQGGGAPSAQLKPSADGRLLGHFPYPEAKASELVSVSPGMQLRADAAKSFLAMQRAAATDGVGLTLLSGFRSIELQRQLFFDVKAERNQSSLERAKVSAPPGFSEHSTGYAIDVGDASMPHTNLSLSFSQTKAYQWLLNHAARYQFALSFPKSNPQGVNFEPWHWRFEGSTDALRLFEPSQRLRADRNA
jgi:D-alanyl-D-alanine carboxypeptidase